MSHLSHPIRRRLASGLVAVATVAALLPGSPVLSPASAAPTRAAEAGEAPESGADVGSVPAIRWKTCKDDQRLQCATYAVPLDYRNPAAGTVKLAVNRLPAKGPGRIGSLFLNPGGPGGSGVDFVAGVAEGPATKELRQHFDLVGFDPRGTNRSTPSIVCEPVARSVRRFDQALGQPGAERTVADALREGRQFAASCQKHSGDLLPFMGTEYAARDMDLLRAAVGDDQLSYLGLSYGTYLGAVYADMFPTRVRAMAVDGTVDPFQLGDDYLGILGANYRASERSVDAFLAWCSAHASDCRFGNGDAEGALDALVAHLDAQPLTKGTGTKAATTNGYTVLYLLYLLTGSGRTPGPTPASCWPRSPPATRSSPTPTCSAPAEARPTSSSSAPTPPAAWCRRTSSASPVVAVRWRSGWGRRWPTGRPAMTAPTPPRAARGP